MLLQHHPINSTSIDIDKHPNGYGVSLAGNHIGSFESYFVHELGDLYPQAQALQLDSVDECYVYADRVFVTQAQAVANLTSPRHECARILNRNATRSEETLRIVV
jgi:hypothetical protein